MPFRFFGTPIDGIVRIEPRAFEDARGFFLECFKESEFARAGIACGFVQENHSHSSYGVLRGLHYQRPPFGQGKLVRVMSGEIFDVAVDLRANSPTYLQWTGMTLSAANRQMVYIPDGCAHGLCVLSQTADIVYHTTAEYMPDYEAGLRWDDPGIGITWPIKDVILSERDRAWPLVESVAAALTY